MMGGIFTLATIITALLSWSWRTLDATILKPSSRTVRVADVVLDEANRAQLSRLAEEAEATLAPQYNQPDWQRFEELEKEGVNKGVVGTFSNHKGTLVPSYVRNGGDDARVRKILDPRLRSHWAKFCARCLTSSRSRILSRATKLVAATGLFFLF